MLAPHIQGVYIICVTVSKVLIFVFCWSPEDFHMLFPTSISIIIHPFSCIRKPVLKPAHKAQLPELFQLVINKISRRNYSAAEKKKKKKWCFWWNITSSWKSDECVLQRCGILFMAPSGICRVKFSNHAEKDMTTWAIFITAVIYEFK